MKDNWRLSIQSIGGSRFNIHATRGSLTSGETGAASDYIDVIVARYLSWAECARTLCMYLNEPSHLERIIDGAVAQIGEKK